MTTLHSFNGTDGSFPYAGLIQGIDGNFYGTTAAGGARGDGTVFKITPGGVLTTLHSFDGVDGENPYARLIQPADGNFYGTTCLGGGAGGDGTVFKITPGGMLTTLHSFSGTDGACPYYAGLIQATDGNIYGTTEDGGTSGYYGTVFRLQPIAPLGGTGVILGGVLNAASYAKNANGQGSAVAPGSLIQIYATLPGANSASSGTVPLPTSLGGVSVTFNNLSAPLNSVVSTELFHLSMRRSV